MAPTVQGEAVAGPDASNWSAVTDGLADSGGLKIVAGPWDLAEAVAPLLADPAAARAMGERARRAAAEASNELDRPWEALQPLLPPAPTRGPR